MAILLEDKNYRPILQLWKKVDKVSIVEHIALYHNLHSFSRGKKVVVMGSLKLVISTCECRSDNGNGNLNFADLTQSFRLLAWLWHPHSTSMINSFAWQWWPQLEWFGTKSSTLSRSRNNPQIFTNTNRCQSEPPHPSSHEWNMNDTITVVGSSLPTRESTAIAYCICRSHIMGRVKEFNYLEQKNISSHLKQFTRKELILSVCC